MLKSSEHKHTVATVRENIIKDIFLKMDEERAEVILLDNGIIYNYIDDQFNEVVSRVNSQTRKVEIDDNHSGYFVDIETLSTEMLIEILENLEDGSFTVDEENEG